MHRPVFGQRRTPQVPSIAAAFVSNARVAVVLAAAALGACAASPATTAADGGCTVDLLAQFSPAISRPTSNVFLQGLVQGTGYDLRYVRRLGTTVLLRLSGPDPSCDGEVARLRRDASVQSLEIDEKSYLPRVPTRTESR